MFFIPHRVNLKITNSEKISGNFLHLVQTLIGNNQTEQIPAQTEQKSITDSSSIRGGSNCLKSEGQNQRGGGSTERNL